MKTEVEFIVWVRYIGQKKFSYDTTETLEAARTAAKQARADNRSNSARIEKVTTIFEDVT